MARKKKEWHRGMTVDHAMDVVGIDRDQLAARLSSVTGDDWTYRMVHNLIGGDKTMTADIVWALSKATGLPYAWFLDDPRDNLDLRDLNADNALSLHYEDIHPVNAGVRDGRWFHRDDMMHLPNPSWWDGLQSETLPIKIAC